QAGYCPQLRRQPEPCIDCLSVEVLILGPTLGVVRSERSPTDPDRRTEAKALRGGERVRLEVPPREPMITAEPEWTVDLREVQHVVCGLDQKECTSHIPRGIPPGASLAVQGGLPPEEKLAVPGQRDERRAQELAGVAL